MRKTTRAEMEDVANDYLNLLNDDNTDRLTSMKRQEQETQIFWESETMQLERQKEMGIRETFDLAPVKQGKKQEGSNNATPDGRVIPTPAGHVMVGKSERIVRVNRYVYHEGKLVKKFRSDCDSTVNVLKADVKNETEAICPSCGGLGTIASYIDGCDYCNSKFTVKDFHAKVSGFSLVEDVEKMAGDMVKKIFFGYIILFMIVWSMGFFGGIASMLFFKVGYTTGAMAWLARFFDILDTLAFTKGFTMVFKAFGIMFVSIIGFSIFARFQFSIANTNVVTAVMPDFNEIAFRQDLEHRIKTALMSRTPAEAMAYSTLDLTEFCNAHKDVFDMSIAKLKFTSASFDEQRGNYVIGVDVTVKLYRMKKGRVSEGYECLHLLVSQFAGIQNSQSSSILEYQCPNCASGINIFHGCTCEYCGTEINKFLLGPVIHQCTWNKQFNVYRNVPIIYFIVVAVLLIL